MAVDLGLNRTIGSVLPFPPPDSEPGEDLWSTWTGGWTFAAAYASARSALSALLDHRCIARLWLPAYLCTTALEAAGPRRVLWYGVDETLRPELSDLAGGLQPGDAVLGVDYFGRSPPDDFLAFARSRPDALWIEDRAQALDPGRPPWGAAVLYSPRKLVGVGDGGLVLSQATLPLPIEEGLSAPEAKAQFARAADPNGLDPGAWYPAFQAQEAAFHVDRRPMSALTLGRLAEVAAAPIAAARRANWQALAGRLSSMALWPQVTSPSFVPLAFPVRTADAGFTVRRLAEAGIFCARHWAELPSPSANFQAAARLSQSLVSLPCDQRYGLSDMDRIADALLAR